MSIKRICIALSALALAGCGGGGGGSDGNSATPTTGTVSFNATDAPVDNVDQVQVVFDRIELKPQGGDSLAFDLDPAVVIPNLLDLQGGQVAELLEDTLVPAGNYEFIRLFLIPGDDPNADDVSFVVEENPGGTFNLLLPGQQGNGSNNRRFLQLGGGFVVPAGGSVDFTIDFVLRKALVKAPGQNGDYFLRPSLRLINNVTVGSIAGNVDAALRTNGLANCPAEADGGAAPAVYLYSGDDAPVGDVFVDENGEDLHDGTTEVSPLVTANVDENGDYSISFVAAGDYTIAYTCQGSLDDVPPTDENEPDSADDDLVFEQPMNIDVAADQVTPVDFDPVVSP